MRTLAALFLILSLLGAREAAAQLILDPGGHRCLKMKDGGPVFLCGPGDPEGFLYRGKRRADGTRDGDQAALIEKLKPTGANCIYLIAVRSHGGDGGPEENPFVDSDPAKGLDGRILRQWDDWFGALDAAGVTVFFIVYDDSAKVWDTGDAVGPEERRFFEGLAERFRGRSRWIWCVAEEYGEALSAARVKAIARVIRGVDPIHPISVHKNHGHDFEEFAGNAEIGLFAVQYNVRTPEELHRGMVEASARSRGRYGILMTECEHHGKGEEARRMSWGAAMGGAGGIMVLGMDIASTAKSDLEDCGRLARFFERARFETLAPHDELRSGGTEYILAAPGARYLLFTARGGERLGLRDVIPGEYGLAWFDPRSGESIEGPHEAIPGSGGAWERPKSFGAEAALLLTANTVRTETPEKAAVDAAPLAIFPGEHWEARDPASAGLDPKRIEAFEKHVGGRGCLVRGGRLVHSWGDAKKPGDVASAAKPLYTHFLLRAVEEGKLKSVDDLAAAFEPRLSALNAPLDHKDRRIRFRDLACQTSGYGVEEGPGTAFDYNDWNMALFFDTLFLKVYKSSLDRVDREVLRPGLAELIGCEDEPTFLAFGEDNRPGRLAISPRDFARFGLLYLREGEWRGKRLLRRESVLLATRSPLPGPFPRTRNRKSEMIPGQRSIGGGNDQTDHKGSYSFAWWTNGVDRDGRRHWPGVPEDAFGAFGHGGMRVCTVIPSLDLIASWNDSPNDTPEKESEAMLLLVKCIAEKRP